MKKCIQSLIVIVFSVTIACAQNIESYVASPALSVGANVTQTNTQTVSSSHTAINGTWGLYRVRLNISTGNSSYGDKEKIAVSLKSPDGSTLALVKTASPTGKRHYLDTWFRDDAPMTIETMLGSVSPTGSSYYFNTPASWKAAGGSLSSKFNNGQTPNGNWTLSITTGAINANVVLNSWELEFRDTPAGDKATSVWVTNSESGYPDYNNCATPKKLDKYHNYYGRTRLSYTGNATTDPDIASSTGKPWRVGSSNTNTTLDNTIWFSFKTNATGGDVNILVSYISRIAGNGYQAVVIDAGSGACVSANWTRVSGTAFWGFALNNVAGATLGTTIVFNSIINCPGLAANKEYYVCIDGEGSGPVSDIEFQIEATGEILQDYTLLPIELLYFKGESRNNLNTLSWATSTELNNAYFELEKSTDGILFTNLATINSQATKGNSTSQLIYQYNDVPCNAYYRMKQVDFNGSFTYFNIIYLERESKNNQPVIMPNPASSNLIINYQSDTNSPTTITIVDVSGREVLSEQAVFNSDNQQVLLNIEFLSKGLYFLTINDGFKIHQQKVVKE